MMNNEDQNEIWLNDPPLLAMPSAKGDNHNIADGNETGNVLPLPPPPPIQSSQNTRKNVVRNQGQGQNIRFINPSVPKAKFDNYVQQFSSSGSITFISATPGGHTKVDWSGLE